MANIELVIKIPEEIYNHIMSMQFYIPGLRSGKSLLEEILRAIRTGISLPEGHGNLFDENDFEKRIVIMTESMDLGYGEIMDIIDEIPTIIEADKEGE